MKEILKYTKLATILAIPIVFLGSVVVMTIATPILLAAYLVSAAIGSPILNAKEWKEGISSENSIFENSLNSSIMSFLSTSRGVFHFLVAPLAIGLCCLVSGPLLGVALSKKIVDFATADFKQQKGFGHDLINAEEFLNSKPVRTTIFSQEFARAQNTSEEVTNTAKTENMLIYDQQKLVANVKVENIKFDSTISVSGNPFTYEQWNNLFAEHDAMIAKCKKPTSMASEPQEVETSKSHQHFRPSSGRI